MGYYSNGKRTTGQWKYQPKTTITDILTPGALICLWQVGDDSGTDYRIHEVKDGWLLLIPEEAAWDSDMMLIRQESIAHIMFLEKPQGITQE